jgi:hypothetical protein
MWVGRPNNDIGTFCEHKAVIVEDDSTPVSLTILSLCGGYGTLTVELTSDGNAIVRVFIAERQLNEFPRDYGSATAGTTPHEIPLSESANDVRQYGCLLRNEGELETVYRVGLL